MAANLRGASLEGADLADADMDRADLTGAVLRGAAMQGARGGRAAAVPVASPQGALQYTLKVGKPVVMALTACAGLRLASVALTNVYGRETVSGDHCAQRMEVQTGPSEAGPWTSVLRFTSAQTTAPQTFAAPADAPVLAGYVQVLVHDTYGGETCFPYVTSLELAGTAWG